VLLMR